MDNRYEEIYEASGRPAKGDGRKLGFVAGALAVLLVEALIIGGAGMANRLRVGSFFGGTTGSSVGSSQPSGSSGGGASGGSSAAGTGETEAAEKPSDILHGGEAEFNAALAKKLAEINPYIDENYIFPVDSDQILDYTLKGYVAGLDDVYSQYMSPEEFKDTMEDSDGAYVGIGVAVQQDPKTMAITAMTVYPNSPAEAAGMQDGDILVKVDGDDITGTDLNEVVSRIRGTEGTQVVVSVYRDGVTLDLTMTRKALDKVTVETEMQDNGIGYLRLTEFDAVSVEQMRQGIADLKSQGMTKLILDLRNNPGGLLTSVVTIADDFLPEANVFYIEDKKGKQTRYDSVKGMIWDGDTVVLINENSASAAEVLSGTLKDNQRATIMGTQSFGKGIVQTFFPLSDGSCVKLTTAHYFTPNGTDIHGVGITPDVVVEEDPETEADEQLDAAKNYLAGGSRADDQAASR